MPKIEEELLSRFESEQQKAMLNVQFTANWLRNLQVKHFKQFGISPEQYNILRILRGAKGRMNMHSVKERMIDRAPNATRLTDKLITKGLVARERCEEDRRVVYVTIKEAGKELLARIDKVQRSADLFGMERMTEADAKVINRALDAWRG